MTIDVQLKSFLAFIILGVITAILYLILSRTKHTERLYYIILPIVAIIFMLVLYYVNNGVIHIYFIFSSILGFVLCKSCVNKLKSKIKLLKKNLFK